MKDYIESIEEEIKGLSNCIDCLQSDGCYMCRKLQPNFSHIRLMLLDLIEYKKS